MCCALLVIISIRVFCDSCHNSLANFSSATAAGIVNHDGLPQSVTAS